MIKSFFIALLAVLLLGIFLMIFFALLAALTSTNDLTPERTKWTCPNCGEFNVRYNKVTEFDCQKCGEELDVDPDLW